jgi:hypothetical protein
MAARPLDFSIRDRKHAEEQDLLDPVFRKTLGPD